MVLELFNRVLGWWKIWFSKVLKTEFFCIWCVLPGERFVAGQRRDFVTSWNSENVTRILCRRCVVGRQVGENGFLAGREFCCQATAGFCFLLFSFKIHIFWTVTPIGTSFEAVGSSWHVLSSRITLESNRGFYLDVFLGIGRLFIYLPFRNVWLVCPLVV